MVLLVTDGQSNEFRHLTIPKADALKATGVEIFVVAVGRYIPGIDESEVSEGGLLPARQTRFQSQ